MKNEIIELIVDKKYIKARDLLLNNNEVDIAEILEDILEEVDPERAVILFRMLPKDVSIESAMIQSLFSFGAFHVQFNCISSKLLIAIEQLIIYLMTSLYNSILP